MSEPMYSKLKQEDIDAMDRAEVLEAMGVILQRLGKVKDHIQKAKAEVELGGDYADPDWFRRVKGAQRSLGWVHQRLGARLSQIKAEEKEARARAAKSWDREFVRVARARLDPDTFQDIHDEVDEVMV